MHFEASDELSHENNITVKQNETGKIDIHIGFLQVIARLSKKSFPNIFIRLSILKLVRNVEQSS